MVSIMSLWLPIVLSAVAVFILSSVMHMVLTYHSTDYGKVPNEDQVRDVIRNAGVQPGGYMFPHATGLKEAGSPEMVEKFNQGPVGLLTMLPNGQVVMPKHLAQWFGFCLLMGVFVAYVTSRTVDPGVEYLAAFRVAGTVAFLGYGMGEIPQSIWQGRSWGTTAKHVFDGLVYALFTAGVFGWLWP